MAQPICIIDKTMIVQKGIAFTLPLHHDNKPGIPPGVNVYYIVLDPMIIGHAPRFNALREGQTTVRVKLTAPDDTYISDCEITIVVVASLTPEKDNYEIVPEAA